MLLVGENCYVANVGDSRAVLSMYFYANYSDGGKVQTITRDHKPEDTPEKIRIYNAGGKIYQTSTRTSNKENGTSTIMMGPHRVFPGRLSVSRTIGDPEAKLTQYGGNPNVVIATPEIYSFKLSDSHDFIVLGCDGIFDTLSSQDVVRCVWNTIKKEKADKVHSQCAIAVDSIIKNSLYHRSSDNVTSVIIAFPHFKRIAFPKRKQSVKKEISTSRTPLDHKDLKKNVNGVITRRNNGIQKSQTNDCRVPQTSRRNNLEFEFGKSKLLRRLHE